MINYLHDRVTEFSNKNILLQKEVEDLKTELAAQNQEDKIKELTASVINLTDKLTKAEENKTVIKTDVRNAYAELETARLLHSKEKAVLEKEKLDLNNTLKIKNEVVVKLKERIKKYKDGALKSIKTISYGFKNCLTSYTAVDYYFKNQALLAVGQPAFSMAPKDVSAASINAMNVSFMKHFSTPSSAEASSSGDNRGGSQRRQDEEAGGREGGAEGDSEGGARTDPAL